MRLLRLLSLCFLLVCGFSVAAHAATMTYTVVFTPVGPGSGGSGTFSVDTTTGELTAADFIVAGFEFTLADALGTPTYGSSGLFYDGFTLGAAPTGLATGDTRTTDVPGPDYLLVTGTNDILEEGSLSITAATVPEPSSFTLLGTGVLGTAGMLRRRLRRA